MLDGKSGLQDATGLAGQQMTAIAALEVLYTGIVIAIEQGAVLNRTRVTFEDDIPTSRNSNERLKRFIPIDIAEVEALLGQEELVRPKALIDHPLRRCVPVYCLPASHLSRQ